MNQLHVSHQQLLNEAKLTAEDIDVINLCRGDHNRLGFAYQLAFVKLMNRFPTQQPFELEEELLTYVSVQLNRPVSSIEAYANRQPTLSEHQERIRGHLGLRRFGQAEITQLNQFLFEQACRLEQTGPLLIQAKQFLKEQGIVYPADDTLRRLIVQQRQSARDHIFERITNSLSSDLLKKLDNLLEAGPNRLTPFQSLKQPPGKPSPAAMLRLANKLDQIQEAEILTVDLSWLNNNYQRALTRYARRCSADRLRSLQANHRYAVLICFLWQIYRDTIDHMVDMHGKLMTGVYNRAQTEIDDQTRKQRRMIRSSLTTFHTLSQVILDEAINDEQLRAVLFNKVDKERLASQMADVETWLTGKYSHVFNLVVQRFSYLRQFAPTLLQHLKFHLEEGTQSTLVKAIELLRDLNEEQRRKLPDDAPLDFIPKNLRPLVEDDDDEINKHAWECALLTAIRDEIRAGNLYVAQSKRFGRFDDFFIDDSQWAAQREHFFNRAGLPVKAEEVPDYLTERLNPAYDRFLELLPENTYANINEDGWQLSVDLAEKLDTPGKQRLETLQAWLADHFRDIKLPELLIEVDNDLHFTHHFLPPAQQDQREAD